MPHFHVRISKDDLTFSAAHFITLGPDTCERLHGHNYRVTAEVHGALDENHYVVDFIAVHDLLREIVDELDHHVLLPADHPSVHVEGGGKEVEVTFGTRRWVFPRSDCRLLPIPNTTTELLARFVGRRLLDELRSRLQARPDLVRVEIEESPGLRAVCELPNQ